MRLSTPSLLTPVMATVVLAAVLALHPTRTPAADSPPSVTGKQGQLIRVLQSDAPPQDKAITCKQLAIYGTGDAVPVLAPLLSNPDLASWARIALEAIPDPTADSALRSAVGTLQGRLLIGVINSLGYRRDINALDLLVAKLKDPDADVVAAAAAALGRIGGQNAANALLLSLTSAPDAARPEVAEGLVQCAEGLLAQGNADAAVKLCDAVREANLPKHKILEATRGAILARRSAGIPLLVQQLRSTDRGFFGIGLRTARELAGREVTDALVAELERTAPDRQALLLSALADRGDTTALPAVEKVARAGQGPAPIAAIRALEQLAPVASAPALLDIASQDNPAAAQAAKASLIRLHGAEVDATLVARLPQATGRSRQTLLEVSGPRRLPEILPYAVRWAEDPDPAVRTAALNTLGTLGQQPQVRDLVRVLQKAPTPQDRAAIERGLLAISGRLGAVCLPDLLPLAKLEDSALRTTALRVLSTVGGPVALETVISALADPNANVQDEAVRTLSTWPNNWPEDSAVAEPLLALARSTANPAHQLLGLRGYLQYLQRDARLSDQNRVDRIKDLRPQLNNMEAKRTAISILASAPTAGALEFLLTFASDSAVAEEACSAVVALAAKNDLKAASKEQRQSALHAVLEKSKDEATKKKATEALQDLR